MLNIHIYYHPFFYAQDSQVACCFQVFWAAFYTQISRPHACYMPCSTVILSSPSRAPKWPIVFTFPEKHFIYTSDIPMHATWLVNFIFLRFISIIIIDEEYKNLKTPNYAVSFVPLLFLPSWAQIFPSTLSVCGSSYQRNAWQGTARLICQPVWVGSTPETSTPSLYIKTFKLLCSSGWMAC